MSHYVDNFIKQHREYFKRNKVVIENNDWVDREKNSEDVIDQLFSEISNLQKGDTNEKVEKEVKKLKKDIFSIKETAKRNKVALFTEENTLTESIFGRLSAFIGETEKTGDRKLDKVQSFINSTVEIISVHIDKCDNYLDYSLDNLNGGVDEDEDEIHFRSEEIKFQDIVFNKKISIQDKLGKLNITNSINNFSIEFFKNQKAAIPMMDVLPSLFDDIKELTENLNLPDKIGDLTFHIHRKKGEYPEWDRKKHYWEQTQETLDYWYNEWLKIKHGFWIDGFFFHPWLYYHLNFYKTQIPDASGGEPIREPDLRDNEWFIAEQFKAVTKEDGYYTTEGVLVFGTRRFGKALRDDSILYYEDGEKPIGQAKIGDKIYGSDGNLTTILGVYPQGKVPLYEVEFGDGRKTICCDEHLWSVYTKNNTLKTLTLKEIRERVSKTNPFYIPLTKPLGYTKKSFKISPYAIGYLIGDGGLTGSLNISFSPSDEEELEEILLEEFSNFKIKLTKTQESRWYVINGKDLKKEIIKLNLNKPSWEKSIPEIYKKGSIKQRFELIQGLLDSDGCVSLNTSGNGKQKSNISFCTTSEKLKDDFIQVCRSLGIQVSQHSRQRVRKGSLNKTSYEVIIMSDDRRLLRLKRKKEKIIDRILGNPYRTPIINITPVESAKATCIRVDNESKQFLTNDYVVTHNSVTASSVCEWRALVISNISTAITSGAEGDLSELTHKIKTSMKTKTPAFNLQTQKQEWSGGTVELGLKKDQSTLLEHSRHTIKNMAGGSSAASQKGAGGAPSIYLIEELAKFAFEKGYLAALPSFETSFGFKTIIFAIGTSGEATLSKDALKAVSNPKTLKFREMDWELFESKITPENITWKRRTFATFIPGQMGYKTGFKRIKKRFGDFLGIDSEYLNKIEIHVTDWENNTRVLEEARELVKNDPLKLQQETVQYPMDPEECFISKDKNIFPAKEARRTRERLEKSGEWDRRRELYKNHDGSISMEISTENLAEYPHNGEEIDAPYLIFEDIPQIKPPHYVYVAGGDFYKQEQSDTDSVGTIYIWKYDLFADPFSRKLVASYSARPSSYRRFNERCYMLLEAYNAVIFPENEDLGNFQTFLERKGVAEQYIMPHIDFNSALQYTEGGKRKYGWTAKQSKTKLLNMFANYLNTPMMILNENGEEVEVKTVETIEDIYLLQELEKFNPDGNFDRITACAGSIGFLHYLQKNYIYPKGYKGNIKREEKPKKKQTKRKPSFYSSPNKRAGFYRKKR